MPLPKRLNKTELFISIIAALFILTSCQDDNPITGPDYSNVPAPFDTTGAERIELSNGLVYYNLEEGYGEFQASERDFVRVWYTARFKSSGEVYRSTYANDNTSPSRLGLSSSPSGIKQGISGMTEGAKRTLVIPPSISYGGVTDTLIFDVELAEIEL